jgi:osmotically-inducible protein OsmY
MKINKILLLFVLFIITGCVGTSSTGVFGTGVSIALDPRTIGTQIDDSIMQKNLSAKLINMNTNYILSVKSKVLDGRIFITGKVETIEEKLKITKLGWEIKGARSVKNDLQIKDKFNFQQAAKDVLITSQLRAAMITNKKIKSVNYNIDTYKKKIYVYGISQDEEERAEVINEAKQILDVEDVIASILLIEDLRVVKN